mmetsp:Transcript_20780/g.29050  ORF Transcript_20780/g.29050 Transcript_20780/m.29050 type:complete len:114 (+) Transcript_20780:2158-2499(+)
MSEGDLELRFCGGNSTGREFDVASDTGFRIYGVRKQIGKIKQAQSILSLPTFALCARSRISTTHKSRIDFPASCNSKVLFKYVKLRLAAFLFAPLGVPTSLTALIDETRTKEN